MAASLNTKIYRPCKKLTKLNLLPKSKWTYVYSTKRSSTNVNKHQAPIEYCVDLVKRCDHESYLCTMLYPKEFRGSAFAVRALYTELAMVQDVTSDNMRAMIRLQFWKDTIDQIYKGFCRAGMWLARRVITSTLHCMCVNPFLFFSSPEHKVLKKQPPQSPVALQVTKAVNKHNLTKSWFTRILEARAQQVNDDGFRRLKDVEDLGEKTVSSLYYLLLETGGIKDVNADHACSHLGKCQSLVTLLRALPFHASKNKVYIPLELLIKHKVSQEEILRSARENLKSQSGNKNEKVCDTIYDIACAAKEHLDTAQSLQKNAPKNAKIIMINSVILNSYLTKLEATDFNVFNPGLQIKDNWLAWKLFKKRHFS